MNTMDILLGKYSSIILLVLAGIIVILLIWNLIISLKLSSLGAKYKRFMRGSTVKNFENMLMDHVQEMESAIERVNIISGELVSVKNQMDKCMQKCNIIRYNAFSDTGSDLSFSIAMLDMFNDGFIITGIYGRNESYSYAKPISKGTSKYPLSIEEEMVLNRSLKGTQI